MLFQSLGKTFTDKEFDGFEREQIKLSHFVTMTEYDPTFDVEVAFRDADEAQTGRSRGKEGGGLQD